MFNVIQTAKLKLVTVIAPSRLEPNLLNLLACLGVPGYTLTRAVGQGQHGESRFGLVDAGNIRIEVLVDGERARQLLAAAVERSAGAGVIAFMADVEAVPADHFG